MVYEERLEEADQQAAPGSHPGVPWSVKDAFLALALVVSVSVIVLVLMGWMGAGAKTDGGPLISASLIGAQGLLVLAVWLYGVRRYQVSWATLGFRRSRTRWSLALPWLVLAGSIFFGGLYVFVVRELGIGPLDPNDIPSSALGEGVYRPINIVVITLVGPLAEEVFFRGFLLATLVQSLGTFRGAALGSAIFALTHPIPAMMAPVFVSGLLLSWLYLKTRSLWPPFLAHAAQNLIAVAMIG